MAIPEKPLPKSPRPSRDLSLKLSARITTGCVPSTSKLFSLKVEFSWQTRIYPRVPSASLDRILAGVLHSFWLPIVSTQFPSLGGPSSGSNANNTPPHFFCYIQEFHGMSKPDYLVVIWAEPIWTGQRWRQDRDNGRCRTIFSVYSA